MSCLGNDLNSVINRMDNNIRTIIKIASPNTEINESGILNSILSQEQLGKIDKEIREYVNTNEPFDKAGGYGIQGCFASFVKRINGDYNNVVGLPVARLYQELKNQKLN